MKGKVDADLKDKLARLRDITGNYSVPKMFVKAMKLYINA